MTKFAHFGDSKVEFQNSLIECKTKFCLNTSMDSEKDLRAPGSPNDFLRPVPENIELTEVEDFQLRAASVP